MGGIPISSKEKNSQFSNLLVPFLILLSSFLISHPLYFLKLLSFLSPLLITTFLVLLFTSYRAVLGKLRGQGLSEGGQLELHCSEKIADENEVFKIFFEASQLNDGLQESEGLVDKFLICGDNGASEFLQKKKLEEDGDSKSCDIDNPQAEKTLEELFQGKEEGECEALDLPVGAEKQVKEAEKESKNCSLQSETEECASRAWRNSRSLSSSLKILEKSSERLGEEKAGSVLVGFGSMRRMEKEWKRTLACKLFEERHNNGGGDVVNGEGDEGMDLLWETYEKNERSTSIPKSDRSKKAAKESKEKLQKEEEEEDEEEEDGDDDDEEMNRRFCCLRALRLSSGKVNLGMGLGRPNMAKISKAFRGVGWLHHVRARKGLR